MVQLYLPLLVVGTLSAQRQFIPLFREAKNLRDVFPFSSVEAHPGEERHEGRGVGVDEDVRREDRQGDSPNSVPFDDVATSYAQGKRCIDKVFMEEVTEWDETYTCEHSYNRRCAKSLKTTYSPSQEEECEENFVKKCFIEYSKTAHNVTARLCRTPLVKDCEGSGGDVVCTTQYESECLTEQEEHQVEDDVAECQTVFEEKCEEDTSGYTSSQKCSKWPREECNLVKKNSIKFTPITKCNKVPVELCGPAGCTFVPGPEECRDETKTVVGDAPEESCSLDPQRTCKFVTKLVPKLEEVENCFDVPKEVCVREQVNPRKVARPVIKKWCYVPKCPDECTEAAKRGECLPQCQEFKGQDRCCAPCSKTCLEAAKKDQCPRECEQYRGQNARCCGGCPPQCKDYSQRCQNAVETGNNPVGACRNPPPECSQYGSKCLYRDPCPETCRENPEQDYCRNFQDILGCYRDTVVVPCEEKPQCYEAAQRGECLNECYETYGDEFQCCPTCPNICKDYAREREMTYVNATSGLDCADFDADPSCFFECPQRCRQKFEQGVTDESCKKYATYLEKCYVPPPCSDECMRAAEREECPLECKQYEGNIDKCCFQCPSECRDSVSRGEENPACQKYRKLGSQCYKPCPSRCEEAYFSKVTEPSCSKFSSVPECYYSSIPTTTTTTTTTTTKPRTPPPTCERNPECAEKSRWGECPAECKQYEGNPDCCAPTCPAKCTNKRRGECSAGGVQECKGIPGCCPEKFDVVYGAGVYLEDEPGDSRV